MPPQTSEVCIRQETVSVPNTPIWPVVGFTMMLVVVRVRLRSQGTHLYPFLDNILIRAPSLSAVLEATSWMWNLLHVQGFIISAKKSYLVLPRNLFCCSRAPGGTIPPTARTPSAVHRDRSTGTSMHQKSSNFHMKDIGLHTAHEKSSMGSSTDVQLL